MTNYLINDYDYTKVRNDIEEKLDKIECALKTWKEISFNTKKDGTPFKSMNKNFNGATYKKYSNYTECPYENGLWITFVTNKHGYEIDCICCYEDDCNKEKLPDGDGKIYMYNIHNYNKYYYVYSFMEIKEKINERIKELEKEIVELKNQLEISFKAYKEFKSNYDSLIESLNNYKEPLRYSLKVNVIKKY